MNKFKRKIISAITAFAFICSMGVNTAEAATRLTTAHLYHWARTANTVRLTQFQRYINLPDKNNNTALCLAQQAKNRNAYKLLLEYGASTDVECHDDDDPICAIIAGDKVKVSPLGWAILGAGALVGAYIALDDDGGDDPKPENQCFPENGEYKSLQECQNANPNYLCEKNINNCYNVSGPTPCPTGYSTDYQDEASCGQDGGWIYTTNGKSGELTCGKCTPKTCQTYSSTDYTSAISCPTVNGAKATDIVFTGYSGNQECNRCIYECDENNDFYSDENSCINAVLPSPTNMTSYNGCKQTTVNIPEANTTLTCWTRTSCPDGYMSRSDCSAYGHGCTEHSTVKGCYIPTSCPTDYEEGLANCNNKEYPSGWTYESENYGSLICGKCTPNQCPQNSSVDTCTDYPYTTPTQNIAGYTGDTPCYTCEYACDETSHHYTQSSTCESKHVGFDCKSTTVDPQMTCFIVDKCETGYLPSCDNGSFYTATASQTYPNPITGDTCNTCEYACDATKGYSTIPPTEGTIVEETMPNGIKCYTSTSCPTDYPYTKAQCEANGFTCQSSTNAPNCYKPISCPTTPYPYKQGKASCSNESGWTYYSQNLDSFICGYCEKNDCPSGETTTCAPAENGAKLTPNPTNNYEGDEQCYTCSYACDETTAYSDKSVCENNENYVCSEVNPNGLSCWKRTADGDCPANTSEIQCTIAQTGYVLEETFTTVGDNKKCYSCNYYCDTDNDWTTTKPHAGRDFKTATTPNGDICYKDDGCPTDYNYTDQTTCETGGYSCTESATGSGCWKRGSATGCPTGYDTKYQTTTDCANDLGGIASGWSLSTNGQSGGLDCGKCSAVPCPASYPNTYTSATKCPTTGAQGYTLDTSSGVYSGDQLCTKCVAKTCSVYDQYSSTDYTSIAKCPTVANLTAEDVNPVGATSYAGENL